MATLATEVEERRDAAAAAQRLLGKAQASLEQSHRDVDTARAGLDHAAARLRALNDAAAEVDQYRGPISSAP
jgi:uncharacterized protein HemX